MGGCSICGAALPILCRAYNSQCGFGHWTLPKRHMHLGVSLVIFGGSVFVWQVLCAARGKRNAIISARFRTLLGRKTHIFNLLSNRIDCLDVLSLLNASRDQRCRSTSSGRVTHDCTSAADIKTTTKTVFVDTIYILWAKYNKSRFDGLSGCCWI